MKIKNFKRNDLIICLFKLDGPCNLITPNEIKIARKFSNYRSMVYKRSRSCIREFLSNIFDISPLEIPLNANPGEAPSLENDYGFISLSHCSDAILIGWSSSPIGIDIEREDRKINSRKIVERFYGKEEIRKFNNINALNFDKEFLKTWVLKESAIKWHKGNISKDIKEWQLEDKYRTAIHKRKQYQINTLHLSIQNWSLGIASSFEIFDIYPLICLH